MTVNCDRPLIFQSELESDIGEKLIVTFKYDQLDRKCSHCCRITHDVKPCPELVVKDDIREEGQSRRNVVEDKRRKAPEVAEAESKQWGKRVTQASAMKEAPQSSGVPDASSHRKPVRRELFTERRDSSNTAQEVSTAPLPSTNEWVQKSFMVVSSRGSDGLAESGADQSTQIKAQEDSDPQGTGFVRAAWYKESVEEAQKENEATWKKQRAAVLTSATVEGSEEP